MRGIQLTRDDHITILQKEAIHKDIYPKATKSIAIHLMSITSNVITSYLEYCRMDLPEPTASVGTRTDYSVGPWDYPACATRHLKAWSTRTTEEKYSVRKLYMSYTVWKIPRRTRLVLSPYSDL
jgi:hypothetical protein